MLCYNWARRLYCRLHRVITVVANILTINREPKQQKDDTYITEGYITLYGPPCTTITNIGRYQLRSTSSEAYILPRTRTRFDEHDFFYSGPAAWNTLPSDLHDITDTRTFRKRLKNVLFDRAFNWFCWRSWTCRIAAPYKFCVDWLIDWCFAHNQVDIVTITKLFAAVDSRTACQSRLLPCI